MATEILATGSQPGVYSQPPYTPFSPEKTLELFLKAKGKEKISLIHHQQLQGVSQSQAILLQVV